MGTIANAHECASSPDQRHDIDPLSCQAVANTFAALAISITSSLVAAARIRVLLAEAQLLVEVIAKIPQLLAKPPVEFSPEPSPRFVSDIPLWILCGG